MSVGYEQFLVMDKDRVKTIEVGTTMVYSVTVVNKGMVVRRLHTSFSGSPWVGNGLDGELAQLVPYGPNVIGLRVA